MTIKDQSQLMKHSVSYHPELDYLLVTTSGRANVTGFRDFVISLRDHPNWRVGMRVLIDHSNLLVDDFSTDEIRQIVEEAVRINEHLGDFPAAVVMNSELAFGLGRMWQLTLESRGGKDDRISIFHSRREAENWLATSNG